jgi:hypothetical protein
VEDGKLLADPVFDTDDEFAVKIQKKVEKKHIRMASVGIEPIELSDSPEHILPGQRRATVSKSEILEASIVDIGANRNALRLYKNGKLIELSAGTENLIPLLKQEPETNPKNLNKMKQIAITLGLKDDATEGEIINAINQLKNVQKTHETVIAEQKEALSKVASKNAEQLVDAAIAAKKITAAQKEQFVKLAMSDFDTAKTVLDTMQAPRNITASLKSETTTGTGAPTAKKFKELSEAELLELRSNEPETYKELFKAEYGFVPNI